MTKVRFAAVALALAALPFTAHAGLKEAAYDVFVFNGQGWSFAYGALGMARNSSDSQQYAGCQVETRLSTGVLSANCFFASPKGEYGYCYTDNPAATQALSGMSSDSYVQVEWDGNGRCTSIRVRNASYHAPKAP